MGIKHYSPNFLLFALAKDFAAILVISGYVFEAHFYEGAGFLDIVSYFDEELVIGARKDVGFKVDDLRCFVSVCGPEFS